MRWILAAILVVIALCTPAFAQEDPDAGFWTPRADYVRLLGQAAMGTEQEAKARLLEERLQIEREKTVAYRELLDLERQKSAGYVELAKIQTDRAEYWKARVEEVEKSARKETRRAKTLAGCATGALTGTFAMPGPGTLIGFGIGCAVGYLDWMP